MVYKMIAGTYYVGRSFSHSSAFLPINKVYIYIDTHTQTERNACGQNFCLPEHITNLLVLLVRDSFLPIYRAILAINIVRKVEF